MTGIASHEQISALIRHRRSIKPVDMDATRSVERVLLTQVLGDATWSRSQGCRSPHKKFKC
ncbi:hypothetical protein [Prosthecobacter sp.]|uniref:hypothetical protein n=1 Tax=Prosthecobacter sp. TaxID=1965333 RepID=UPI00378440C8